MKTNDVAFGFVYLSSYLPLRYPTHFFSLRSDYYTKSKTNAPRHEISNNVVCATSNCAYAQSDQSICSSFEYSMTVWLLTEHYLEFLSLTGGCTGSFESTLVKIPHCWKSHVMSQIVINQADLHILHIFLLKILLNVQG